jgi:hypothetical protein
MQWQWAPLSQRKASPHVITRQTFFSEFSQTFHFKTTQKVKRKRMRSSFATCLGIQEAQAGNVPCEESSPSRSINQLLYVCRCLVEPID